VGNLDNLTLLEPTLCRRITTDEIQLGDLGDIAVAAEQASEHDGGTMPLYVLFPLGVVCLWAIAQPWATQSVAVYLPLMAMTSFVFLCYTSCFHETVHHTLGNSKWFSIVVGRILGTVMFTPYSTYRESHVRHHAYLNKPNDFELWPYSDPNVSLWFRRGFVWLDVFFGFIISPMVYGRTFLCKASPVTDPKIRRAIVWEYVLIFAFWIVVAAIATWQQWWFQLITVWLIPHWVAGIMQTGRKLTEHLGMASYDPLMGTRTVVGTNWWTRFCTWMNFDIFVHGPHHRHPRLGHTQLIEKMGSYAQTAQAAFPVFGSYHKATLAMLPWMFKNPGVGVNAGARSPTAEKVDKVDKFVSDVSKEIISEVDLEVVT